jgi:hypothetical protein
VAVAVAETLMQSVTALLAVRAVEATTRELVVLVTHQALHLLRVLLVETDSLAVAQPITVVVVAVRLPWVLLHLGLRAVTVGQAQHHQ